MGNPFAKLAAGASVTQLSVSVYNEVLDMLGWWRTEKRRSGADPSKRFRQTGIVLIQNNGNYDLGRGDVLGIDGPLIEPSITESEFLNRIILKGIEPTSAHEDIWVVLMEPIAKGVIGRACVAGVCVAKINVGDANDTHARLSGSSGSGAYRLDGGGSGAFILWKPSGLNDQWALLYLSPGAVQIRVGKLNSSLSSGGSEDMTVWSGNPLVATSETPEVNDWFLPSGDEYATGTKVVEVKIAGKRYVINAECNV